MIAVIIVTSLVSIALGAGLMLLVIKYKDIISYKEILLEIASIAKDIDNKKILDILKKMRKDNL